MLALSMRVGNAGRGLARRELLAVRRLSQPQDLESAGASVPPQASMLPYVAHATARSFHVLRVSAVAINSLESTMWRV